MILTLYKILTTLGRPFLKYYLHRRVKKGKEDPIRLGERYGIASLERPEGTLVWCHGASVGESVSLLSVIKALEKKGVRVLVTTGTVTAAHIMEKNLPPTVIHQYFPLDVTAWVTRFLQHWKPSLGIFVESELWPNMLQVCQYHQIPLILANAHLSQRSFNRWKCFPKSARRLLSSFSVVLAQSSVIADRLTKLGAMAVHVVGNLKFAGDNLPFDFSHFTQFNQQLKKRPVWAAVSTHHGEEEIILQAHKLIQQSIPDVLTILIPRHPSRALDINRLIESHHLRKSQRSLNELPQKEDSIYVVDTMGETGLFYRLCPISFIGGTLVPIGGHNPIEPIKLNSHVVWGPYHQNCQEIALLLKGAITCVHTAQQLADKIIYGLTGENAYRAEKDLASKVVEEQKNSLLELMDVITFFLNKTAALTSPLPPSFFEMDPQP